MRECGHRGGARAGLRDQLRAVVQAALPGKYRRVRASERWHRSKLPSQTCDLHGSDTLPSDSFRPAQASHSRSRSLPPRRNRLGCQTASRGVGACRSLGLTADDQAASSGARAAAFAPSSDPWSWSDSRIDGVHCRFGGAGPHGFQGLSNTRFDVVCADLYRAVRDCHVLESIVVGECTAVCCNRNLRIFGPRPGLDAL